MIRSLPRPLSLLRTTCRPAVAAALLSGILGCPAGNTSRSPGGTDTREGTSAPPSPAGREGEIGLRLLSRGDLAGAEPALLEAVRKSPQDARLLEALGAVYGRTDRWQKAEETYRLATQADPRSAGARLGLAKVFMETGRYQEALGALADARRLDPGNREALVKEALLLQRTGRAGEAKAKASAVIARWPDEIEARYVLGLALEEEGELEAAMAEFGRVVEKQPDHLGALSRLVTIAGRLGRTQEAERARQAHREALSRRRVEERVRGYRLKGVEAFNREDYQGALVAFEAIAREDPSDFQAPLYLGSALLALGRREEARAAIERSLRLQPRNERALMELGRLEALEDHLEAAITALRQAIAVNPEFAEPHYFLAAVHAARGETEEARQETRRFEELRRRSQGSAMEIVDPGGAPR